MPFLVFRRDHYLPFGIICVPIWGSSAVEQINFIAISFDALNILGKRSVEVKAVILTENEKVIYV